MRFSIQALVLALAASSLPQQVFSRAITQTGSDGSIEERRRFEEQFVKPGTTVSIAGGATRTGIIVPRGEPVIVPKPTPKPTVVPKPESEPKPSAKSGDPEASGPLEPGATPPASVNPGPLEPEATALASVDAGPIDPETVGAGATNAPDTVKESNKAQPTEPPKPEEPAPTASAGVGCIERRTGFGTFVKRCPGPDGQGPSSGKPEDDAEGDGSEADVDPDVALAESGYQIVKDNPVDNAKKALTDRIKNKSKDNLGIPQKSWEEVYLDKAKGKDVSNDVLLTETFPHFETMIATKGINIKDEPYREVDLVNKEITDADNKLIPSTGETIMQTYVSEKGEVLMATYSMRKNDNAWTQNQLDTTDKAQKIVPGALTWSELAFQTMRDMQSETRNLKNLKWVVRTNIENQATLDTLKMAYSTGKEGDKIKDPSEGVFWNAESKLPLERAAFNALSRTVNVKSTNWMLADHHNAFGDKKITGMYTFYTPDAELADIFLLLG